MSRSGGAGGRHTPRGCLEIRRVYARLRLRVRVDVLGLHHGGRRGGARALTYSAFRRKRMSCSSLDRGRKPRMAADFDRVLGSPHGGRRFLQRAFSSVRTRRGAHYRCDEPPALHILTVVRSQSNKNGFPTMMLRLWEGVRYFAAYGAIALIIAFWYWMFKSIGTF